MNHLINGTRNTLENGTWEEKTMSEQDNATDFIQSSNKAREYENKKKNKSKHKCTGWAIVATMERPDGTWYDETITE